VERLKGGPSRQNPAKGMELMRSAGRDYVQAIAWLQLASEQDAEKILASAKQLMTHLVRPQ
jgi:hypothetical protein